MMTEAKKILEYSFVAAGNVISWVSALFMDSAITGAKDILAIWVSVMTIIWLYYKIQNERNKDDE